MMIIGITGGIGSGKTIVCNVFKLLGIPVYEADQQAKNLYEIIPELTERISTELSPDLLDKKGNLNKQKLAALVFDDEVKLQKLNKIVHPYVIRHFEEWCNEQQALYVLKEAAILFESGTNKGCDKIITVTAPVDMRIQRAVQRDKRTKEAVDKIIQQQWTDEEKINRSDYVIVNDEQQLVIPQVISIHEKILALLK
jgi:dephospho-CoA kinase